MRTLLRTLLRTIHALFVDTSIRQREGSRDTYRECLMKKKYTPQFSKDIINIFLKERGLDNAF